jgi:hypothetical protein
MRLRVEHRVDDRGMPMPHTLQFDGRHVHVVETLDQWHGSDHRYVKVRCDDGCLYILRHDAAREGWELTMFESGRFRSG